MKMNELSNEEEAKIRQNLEDRKKLILKEMQDNYHGDFKVRE